MKTRIFLPFSWYLRHQRNRDLNRATREKWTQFGSAWNSCSKASKCSLKLSKSQQSYMNCKILKIESENLKQWNWRKEAKPDSTIVLYFLPPSHLQSTFWPFVVSNQTLASVNFQIKWLQLILLTHHVFKVFNIT